MSTDPDGRRRSKPSFLRRTTFNPLSSIADDADRPSTKTLKKKLSAAASIRPSSPDTTASRDSTSRDGTARPSGSPQSRPQLLKKGGRPSSILGSFRSFRLNEDDTPPGTATSSKAPSFSWQTLGAPADLADIGKNRNVLHHGEVQTNSSMFWRKKEYLVLTETHLIRFKNQGKASETFSSISLNHGRAGLSRHTSAPSAGSLQDLQSLHSDTSGERITGIPLEQIVAVVHPDEARNSLSLEITYLDSEAGQGASIVLQYTEVEEKELWCKSIRFAANNARLLDIDPISPKLSEYAARVVEREQDYDIANYRIYKVVKRSSTKQGSKVSTDEFSKTAATVCFLVIGIRKVHIIVLPKNVRSASMPSLSDLQEGGHFGIMKLVGVGVSVLDDSFYLAFRGPFEKAVHYQLASLAASEIALRLRHTENYLRPEWLQRPYVFEVPLKVDEESLLEESQPYIDDHEGFDRTLIAYCVAYGVNPAVIRYAINYSAEDNPRFDLLEPAYHPPRSYSPLELLAIFRSLRFNESFVTISFANVSLDGLNGAFDRNGFEHVCVQSNYGRPIKLDIYEEQNMPLLVQEIRAVALSSKRLRRFDFSGSVYREPPRIFLDDGRDQPSSGVVEAISPLCKKQATNVDWITFSGINLGETDLDHFVGMAAEKCCHFRALEVGRCGLTDRGLTLLLDAFRSHDNTLEVIDISDNPLRLVPSMLSRQLAAFAFIRKLDLSNLAVTTSATPLVPLEILTTWRLEDVRLRGIALNGQTLDALKSYFEHSQSEYLREVVISNCSLTGENVGDLMVSMSSASSEPRFLHLDISENRLEVKHDRFTSAIAQGHCTTHMTMKSIEYELEESFRGLLLAVANNKILRYLNVSRTSLPAEASIETCKALEKLFRDNKSLEDLDISGADTRLEVSKLGTGINDALGGLKHNTSLTILRIQHQKLGLPGASALAEVLKENKTLRQLHCDSNGITLSGFTDMVNSLATNTTLLYLPNLEEGRNAALKQTEMQIKIARTRADGGPVMTSQSSRMSSMRRTLANISGTNTSPKALSKVAAVPQWTEQDVQAALRLVSEGWEGQAHRLEQYLGRNWKIFEGMKPEEANIELDIEDKNHRPGTANSISKILEKVQAERTPTVEKQLQLGDPFTESKLPTSDSCQSMLKEVEIDDSSLFDSESKLFHARSSKRADDDKYSMKENVYTFAEDSSVTNGEKKKIFDHDS